MILDNDIGETREVQLLIMDTARFAFTASPLQRTRANAKTLTVMQGLQELQALELIVATNYGHDHNLKSSKRWDKLTAENFPDTSFRFHSATCACPWITTLCIRVISENT